MKAKTHKLAVAVIGMLVTARVGLAQESSNPPWWAPPVAPAGNVTRMNYCPPSLSPSPSPSVVYAPQTAPVAPAPACPCGAVDCSPHEDNNGDLLRCDPLLNSCAAPPGWFGAVEVGVVAPTVRNLVNGPVTVGGVTTQVQLPTATLSWNVSPRFELGYRFGEGAGELVLSYKFLASSGDQTIPGFDAAGDPGALHSRNDLETWDLDYANHDQGLIPCLDLKWWIGIQAATVFFDSNVTSPLLDQQTNNYFYGVGPHFGVEARHVFQGSGLGVFGRFENSWLIGEVYQAYSESFPGAPGGPVGGATDLHQSQIVPWIGAEAGVEYSPPGYQQFRLSVGYIFERWWNVAQAGSSLGDVTDQGIIFRAELRY
jgi:hypothetical protein